MVRLAVLPCAAALVLLLGACGAGHQRNVSAKDLAAIAAPPPPVPKGAYREDNTGDPSVFSLANLRARTETPAEKAALPVLAKAGFERGYQKAWSGDIGNRDRSANVIVFLFRDASGTSDVLVALPRLLNEQLGEENSKITQVDAAGLGEESWGERAAGEDEEFAYGWRSRNLVLIVDMVCFLECEPADQFRESARAYADAVDGRAEKAGR